MELEISVPFDKASDDDSFWARFPDSPAVFALFLAGNGGALSPPYLSQTTNLNRRLKRLLGKPQLTSVSTVDPEKPSAPLPSRPRPVIPNLRAFVTRIAYQPTGSNFESRWLLYRLNKVFYPQSYRRRLRLKPPTLLKISLKNRFPRCYSTRKISADQSLYYGPFPSRSAAERFANEFLNLFKMRRCVEDLEPDPAHPGCIYSQMRMCLAPCFKGCTDEEYQQEVSQVVAFMDSQGQSLLRSLERERTRASEGLEFEEAAKLHHRIEKVNQVLALKPGLARNLADLNGIIVQPGAGPKSVALFRIVAGELLGPARLSLDERVALPISLDEQIRNLLDSLLPQDHVLVPHSNDLTDRRTNLRITLWEHLSILARWYYSSFREGELIMVSASQEIPHARVIRLCRKMIAADTVPLR